VGEEQRLGFEEMLALSREAFDVVPDFTVAVEEEFALIDPETLGLVNRFEELQEAARGTELEPHLVGELIASEIEVRTGRCDSFADMAALLGERRQQLRALAEPRAVALAATGTHPWSPWQEQRIIDTPHYRLNDQVRLQLGPLRRFLKLLEAVDEAERLRIDQRELLLDGDGEVRYRLERRA
jgi:hypothetical protein